MEHHELAIAALEKVVHSTDTAHRENSSAKVSSNSTDDATATDIITFMMNNEHEHVGPREPLESQEIEGEMSQTQGGQDSLRSRGVEEESTLSNNSQASIPAHESASTPPTSEECSSQSTSSDGFSQLSQLSQLAAVQEPLMITRPILSIAPTAGHKRTADGQVKPAFSPTSPRGRGHSRNTSAVSNISSASSRMGELSSELRTRLSYAMVKVNHGWQSNSIDEVESLASQKGSPTSSTSTIHGRHLTSPRATIASIQGQTSNLSAVSQTSSGDFDLYFRTEPANRTYESFWADHSSASLPITKPVRTTPPPKALAPPADIRPTNSRRSGTPKFIKPPTLSGQGSGSSYHNTSAPRTPNRAEFKDSQTIQTPTQKTIQEQDAIETLLFMSSPGNSGNLGHAFPPPRTIGSPQQSPLRAEFNIQRGAQGRRVGFDDTATVSTTSSDGPEYRRKLAGSRFSKPQRGKPDAIDQMLDAMPDSSSDDEDPILTYTASPRRVEAGRV